MKYQKEIPLTKRYCSGHENADFSSCHDKCCEFTSSQDVENNRLNSPPEQLSNKRASKDKLVQIRGIRNVFVVTGQ